MTIVRGFIIFLVLVYCNLAYAQSITVGPDGKFKKAVISVPYAFYNENFGFAGAYAYAVTGWPQKIDIWGNAKITLPRPF